MKYNVFGDYIKYTALWSLQEMWENHTNSTLWNSPSASEDSCCFFHTISSLFFCDNSYFLWGPNVYLCIKSQGEHPLMLFTLCPGVVMEPKRAGPIQLSLRAAKQTESMVEAIHPRTDSERTPVSGSFELPLFGSFQRPRCSSTLYPFK